MSICDKHRKKTQHSEEKKKREVIYITEMYALTPITGTLKRRIDTDILVGFTLGGGIAAYWWWGFHKGVVDRREAYYAKLAEQKKQEE